MRVGGDKNIKPLSFRSAQQFAVAKGGPATLIRGHYFVAGQALPQRDGRSLIEQDAHSGRCQCAAGSVLQYGTHLVQGHAREPFNELINRAAVFKIFKQRGHGHA